MARNYQNWEDIGAAVQDIVDRAINTQDYQKLNQTIRQTVDRAVDLGEEAVRKVVDSAARQSQPRQTVVEQRPLPVLYGSTGGKTALGIVKIVGGGMLSAVSLILFITALAIDTVVAGFGGLGIGAAVLLAGGLGLITGGVQGLNRLSRFKTYRRILGSKTQCSLERLAQAVGKSEKFVRREVRKLIDQRLFLQGHMDREQKHLITSDETYRLFERSRLELEQRQREQKRLEEEARARREANPVTPQVQEVLDKGNAFLREIRCCNDLIPGEEISGKISRMETIVQRIFQRAESHPEIIPDLKKMMDYYLPMTVKLLRAYADMDAQPVQGQTILSSKREIEATLDTLNLAFEKLLDSVFSDTALDVSSDISVLHTLLAQNGLTEDGLSQARNHRKENAL